MSVGAINIADRGFVLNNLVDSVNLFPWVHHETIQRGSLAASPLGSILTNNRIITWKTMFRKTPKTGSGEYFISTRAIPDILFLKV